MKTVLSVLIVFVILSGCNKNETDQSYLNVETVNAKDLENILSAEKGKVVLLNIWATWCSPCTEEFPDLIKLADHYRSQEVKIIAISVNYPDEIDSKIVPFLKQAGVNFPVYVQNYEKQEDLINQLNTEWSGAIPASFLFGKNGKQADFLLGKHNFDQFRSKIDNILELN